MQVNAIYPSHNVELDWKKKPRPRYPVAIHPLDATMQKLLSLLYFILLLGGVTSLAEANTCGCTGKNCPPPCKERACCGGMGGILYCDSSAGRYVCHNGYYSSCYCTIHAIMDLQQIQTCCTWQGGVFTVVPESGLVICNNGGVSEICTLGNKASPSGWWLQDQTLGRTHQYSCKKTKQIQ